MAKELIWSNEDEYVFGRQVEFENKEDFIKTVKDQYENGECNVVDIAVEPCFHSAEPIPSEYLVPLSLTDFCIENYFMGKVVPVEGKEQTK